MTNNQDNTKAIREALETIRSRRYPEVPAPLMNQILGIEWESLDERQQALREVERLLNAHLEEE